jgi:hypothetical protein
MFHRFGLVSRGLEGRRQSEAEPLIDLVSADARHPRVDLDAYVKEKEYLISCK